MHSEKKITKEDTWKPADLRRHIRERDHSDGYARRRDDNERRNRVGESIERRHRDTEESRRDRDKREKQPEKGNEDGKEKYVERRKEGSQTRRAEKDLEKRYERDRGKNKLIDDNKGDMDRKRDREERHDRERNKDRHKDKEKKRVRDTERHTAQDKDKRREEKDKERRREERDKEHRSDRRRHEESVERRGDHREMRLGEQSYQQYRNDYEEKRKNRDIQERHKDRKHSERKEEKDYKAEHRRHKEGREQKHIERGHHDEKWKHGSEFREHQDMKESDEGVRLSRGNSDRAERDKHREMQKKEEEDAAIRYREKIYKKEDVKRNHSDRTSSKTLSSSSHRHERKEAATKEVGKESETSTVNIKHSGNSEELVVNDEDLAEQEYEDDFEDYEDDFEEMDENAEQSEDEKLSLHLRVEDEEVMELTAQQRKEIEAIQRAMAEENERAGTAQSRPSTSREEEDMPKWSKDSDKDKGTSSQRGKFINFVAAKQREVSQKVATKQKKRSNELLRLIDLDFSTTFCLLDLPPVSEYDMYIRNFGNANTKQAYVQCNEDNADRDIQTEEIEMTEKWTQHPPEHHGACGDPNLSQREKDETRSNMNIDSQHLTSFLRSASQVMVVLLEENQAERKSLRKLKSQTDSLSFSDGSLQLNTELPFLCGRQISLMHFSQVQRHTMMSVHMPTANPSAVHLNSSTIICIWNIWEPSRPQKILVYESEVQCCCFSPGKATLVFAGTSVGSVVLWDLREQASNHYCLKIGADEWTLRQPTFSTDAVMAASAHFSPVTAVEVVPSTIAGGLRAEFSLLASEEETSGLSFQLASLDESGLLNFWVVVELPNTSEAGSPTDLGLRPGGKVKLLHSSSLLTTERSSARYVEKTWPSQTLLLKFHPADSNHFFIGTNLGVVSHGTSHGLKAPPKFYRFQEGDVQPVDVNAIHFSPFKPHMFLVGCGDGSIRLHTVSHEQPVAEWRSSTAGNPVVSLQWAQTRPTVFCVLDAASNFHLWDLLKNDAEPVVTERMDADRLTAMGVFGDSGQQNSYSGIALAHESGKIELLYFSTSFTVSSCAEEGKLDSLISEVF